MNSVISRSNKLFRVQYLTVRANSTLQQFKSHINDQLEQIKAAGTFKNERIIVTKQGSHIKVAGNNNEILNFCANNYLGLSVSIWSAYFRLNSSPQEITCLLSLTHRAIPRSFKAAKKLWRNMELACHRSDSFVGPKIFTRTLSIN